MSESESISVSSLVLLFADTTSPPFDMAEVAKVPHWVDMICDRCILGLVKLQKPFKYIVSTAIVQNVSITAWFWRKGFNVRNWKEFTNVVSCQHCQSGVFLVCSAIAVMSHVKYLPHLHGVLLLCEPLAYIFFTQKAELSRLYSSPFHVPSFRKYMQHIHLTSFLRTEHLFVLLTQRTGTM